MRRIWPGFEAIQGYQQQGMNFLVGQRAREQTAKKKIATTIAPQTAINQILNGGPGQRFDTTEQAVGKALSAKYGQLDASGLQKGKGEGVGR